MKEETRRKTKRIIGIVLLVSLIASIAFIIVRLIFAPTEATEENPRAKSDYVLMLFQCFMGAVIMFLPSLLQKKWNIEVPDLICILFYIFLYCAVFLGEVFRFYYIVPFWDTILHAFSGAMLGILGFELVNFLNKGIPTKVKLSPFFVSLFAFCFALTIGALWEVYEYSFDALLGLNMQKHTTADGVPLVGTAALRDTMKDLIVDAIAAFAVALLGFLTQMKKKKPKESMIPSIPVGEGVKRNPGELFKKPEEGKKAEAGETGENSGEAVPKSDPEAEPEKEAEKESACTSV